MIFNFDAFDRSEKPTLVLCNPNDQPIGVIAEYSNLSAEICFNSISEISFEVEKFFGENANPLFDKLQPRREVLVTDLMVRKEDGLNDNRDLGYFIITDVSEDYSGSNPVKTITANSCEYELNKTELHYVEGVYRMYEDGNDECILNQIMKRLPKWSLGHVDGSVAGLYRTFEFGRSTVYNFLMSDFAEAYGVIVEYNILDRKICIYDKSTYISSNNQRTHITISTEDIVDSIKTQEDINELFTAIYVPSNGDLSISTVNPSRENTVYNFDYFMNTEWMSQELIDKLNEWKNLRDSVQGKADVFAFHERLQSDVSLDDGETVTVFPTSGQVAGDYYIATHNFNKTLNGEVVELLRPNDCTVYIWNGSSYVEISHTDIIYPKILLTLLKYEKEKFATITSELDTLINADLVNLNTQKATIISSSSTNESKNEALAIVNNEISIVEDKISAKQFVLGEKQALCNSIELELDKIADSIKIENVLNSDQLTELSSFIFEGSFEDNSIIVTESMSYAEKIDQSQALYEKAIDLINKTSTPSVEFDIDIDGIVFNKDFQHLSNEINTGCIIGVFNSKDELCEYILLKVLVDYDSESVKMTFGNRFRLRDATSVFSDLYASISKTGSTVNYIKDIFDFNKANKELSDSESFRNNSLDLTKNAIISSKNQDMVIDSTGLRGKKFDEVTGEHSKEQVWLCNNTLAFTEDDFETVKTAVGKMQLEDGSYVYGVNADAILAGVLRGIEIYGGDKFHVDKDGRMTCKDASVCGDMYAKTLTVGADGSWAFVVDTMGIDMISEDSFNSSLSLGLGIGISSGACGGVGINAARECRIIAGARMSEILSDENGISLKYKGKTLGIDNSGVYKLINGIKTYL